MYNLARLRGREGWGGKGGARARTVMTTTTETFGIISRDVKEGSVVVVCQLVGRSREDL